MTPSANPAVPPPPRLERRVGLAGATALNMVEMIGVGPFITMPLIIHAMGGPQAMLGWIFGALFALCDGMVWAELGATFPDAGGSYKYLSEIYGPARLGRMLSFLFAWQISFSAPLSIASGCVGLAQYAAYLWPSLSTVYWAKHFLLPTGIHADLVLNRMVLCAMASCVLAIALCYRGIGRISQIAKLLWAGVLLTVLWVIVSGVTHFSAARAFAFPPHAFLLDSRFFSGLGAAILVATYDYWGYYSVNFFGSEVKDPARNIPRAITISIVAVACLYLLMNISILGVVPWPEMNAAAISGDHQFVISTMMQRLYGRRAADLVTLLIMWTAFASVISLLVSASRVPYAAAQDGNYFRMFSHLHPAKKFPDVSLLSLGITAIAFCTLRLIDLIAALVIIRILTQFLAQTIGILILRQRQPSLARPFRMWLYPWPALLATAGFIFVLIERPDAAKEIRYAALIIIVGTAIYLLRSFSRSQWPFPSKQP